MNLKRKNFLIEYLLIIISILLVFDFIGCKSPTSPKVDEAPDTTSHNFTFQTWHFGEHSSSSLNDVAIIDENDIWAVGEIYMNDSLGNADPQPYNAAHWNGRQWEIIRVPTKTFAGSIVSSRLQTVLSFSKDDIWTFSIAGSYSHWNGISWKTEFVKERTGGGNSMWGTSSSDVYLVCSNGGISHYDGRRWEKIESGTDLDIYDIWGAKSASGDYEILCAAAKLTVNRDKKILQIKNNSVKNMSAVGIPSSITGIWFKPGNKYYVVGSGMFTKSDIFSAQGWHSIWEGITQYYTTSIDGNDLNDIVVCGSYGELLHYNGLNWKSYRSKLKIDAGAYGRVKIKGDLVIAVGYDSPKAVITIGRR